MTRLLDVDFKLSKYFQNRSNNEKVKRGLCPLRKKKVSLVFRIVNIDLKVSKLKIRYLAPPPLKKVTLVTKIVDIDLNLFKYITI